MTVGAGAAQHVGRDLVRGTVGGVDHDPETVEAVRQGRTAGGRRTAGCAAASAGPGRRRRRSDAATARRSRASIASSSASASLCPPRAKNLMPLSGIGLCDAEIITPRSASRAAVRNATAGVGSTPTSQDVDAGAGQAGDHRGREELPGCARVAADDRRRPVPLERADLAEHVGRRDGEVEGELGREVAVGHPTHAVGAEDPSHVPESSRGSDARRAPQNHACPGA